MIKLSQIRVCCPAIARFTMTHPAQLSLAHGLDAARCLAAQRLCRGITRDIKLGRSRRGRSVLASSARWTTADTYAWYRKSQTGQDIDQLDLQQPAKKHKAQKLTQPPAPSISQRPSASAPDVDVLVSASSREDGEQDISLAGLPSSSSGGAWQDASDDMGGMLALMEPWVETHGSFRAF